MVFTGVSAAAEKVSDGEIKTLLSRPEVVVIDLSNGDRESGMHARSRAVHEDPTSVPSWAAKYPMKAPIVLFCS